MEEGVLTHGEGRVDSRVDDISQSPNPPESEGMVACRIVVGLPPGGDCYVLTTEHPELLLKVIGCMSVSGHEMIEDVEVEGNIEEGKVAQLLRASPAVKSVELISISEQTSTHRVVMRLCPVISTCESLRILPRLPLRIQGGKETFLVVSTPPKVRELIRRLKGIFQGVEVAAITHDYANGIKGLLTPRQLEIFKLALSSGYWDIPRRTTLTDMALMLGIAKSTIHETLAILENKIIHDEVSRLAAQL